MVPLIINPMYTLYSGYLLGISPFRGYHPKGTTICLMSADSYLPLTGFEKNGGVFLRDLKLPLSREKLQELTGDPRCFFFEGLELPVMNGVIGPL